MRIKFIELDQFRERLDEALAWAEEGFLLITRDGRPWIVAHSVERAWDAELAAIVQSPRFGELMAQHRGEEGIPWEEVQRLLG